MARSGHDSCFQKSHIYIDRTKLLNAGRKRARHDSGGHARLSFAIRQSSHKSQCAPFTAGPESRRLASAAQKVKVSCERAVSGHVPRHFSFARQPRGRWPFFRALDGRARNGRVAFSLAARARSTIHFALGSGARWIEGPGECAAKDSAFPLSTRSATHRDQRHPVPWVITTLCLLLQTPERDRERRRKKAHLVKARSRIDRRGGMLEVRLDVRERVQLDGDPHAIQRLQRTRSVSARSRV